MEEFFRKELGGVGLDRRERRGPECEEKTVSEGQGLYPSAKRSGTRE